MPHLKFYDTNTEEWKTFDVDGNNIRFTEGEYRGKTLFQVITELKGIAAGGAVTRNTLDFQTIKIEEDDQTEVALPTRIDPESDSFLLFLNLGVLSKESYTLSSTGDSIIFEGNLYAGDELCLVIFKTVRTAPPDHYDGIIIIDGSIQESKLAPNVQKKINNAIPSREIGVSLATLVEGKVPAEQLPNLDYSDLYAPLQHKHPEYALVDHTHDNSASEEALRAHTEDETLHSTPIEKETLKHIRYNDEMKCIEFVFPN